jgi:hypothetical protein
VTHYSFPYRFAAAPLGLLLALATAPVWSQTPSPLEAGETESGMDRIAPAEDAETRRCLPRSQIRRIETVDDRTLIFHMRDRSQYVNHLPYRCAGLKNNSFIHETSLNAYCDLDIISVVDMRIGMRLGSCPLGPFEKIEPALD